MNYDKALHTLTAELATPQGRAACVVLQSAVYNDIVKNSDKWPEILANHVLLLEKRVADELGVSFVTAQLLLAGSFTGRLADFKTDDVSRDVSRMASVAAIALTVAPAVLTYVTPK